jgi:hypothetical protein
MAMTKKNFIQTADALRAARPSGTLFTEIQMEQWESQVRAMADMFEAANPQFKRDRWLNYVYGRGGVNGGPITR